MTKIPVRDRTKGLKSLAEAKIARRLNETLAHIPGLTKMTLLTNQSLTSLVSNERGGWAGYAKRELHDLWGLNHSHHTPVDEPFWPSTNSPPFGWSSPKPGYPTGQAIFTIGGPYTKNYSLWSKRHNKTNTEWVRRRYLGDPAIEYFLSALESEDEGEMNRMLESCYPRTRTSSYKRRLQWTYSTEIDFLVVEDPEWTTPLTSVSDTGRMDPLHCGEYCGLIGCCIVNGELKFSRLYVGDSFRFDDGTIDDDAVAGRLQKFRDELAITRDLRIPMVILPHYAIITVGSGPQSYMLSDIAFFHCHAIARHIRKARYADSTWDQTQRSHDIAAMSLHGHLFTTLRGSCVSVTLERIEMELPDDMTDDSNIPTNMLHGEYVRDRMATHGYTLDDHLEDLGLSRDRVPGLRLTAQHQEHGTESVDMAIPVGFGCSIHQELDHLMLAGHASAVLLERFQQPLIANRYS